jgi:ADP-ribose pyrophosphatase
MSEAAPEVKRSGLIYTGRVFRVTVDEVMFADGRTVKMDVVRHPGSVVLLPTTAHGHLLLVRQYRYVVDRWLWELPAGTREPGESLEAAARRECHEEVGKVAERAEQLWSFFPSPGFCDEEMHFFRMTGLRDRLPGEAEAHQDPDEVLNVREFSIDEARTLIKSGEIRDMKTALGLSLITATPNYPSTIAE